MNDYTKKALKTWYKENDKLYKNPLPAVLGLAGEIGELVDLFKKYLFKPNFDWTDCKHCRMKLEDHDDCFYCAWGWENDKIHTSMVLDELGDIWFYLRILAWIYDIKLLKNWEDYAKSELINKEWELYLIKEMYRLASEFMQNNDTEAIKEIYYHLLLLLVKLDCTLNQLTGLNYLKLNSEDTNYGWKDAK